MIARVLHCRWAGASSMAASPPRTPLPTASKPSIDGLLVTPDKVEEGPKAEALPHEGVVFLDCSGSSQFLSNVVAQERVQMQSGAWHLIFNDQGFGALVNDEEPGRAIDVDEVLKHHLFQEPATKQLYVATQNGRLMSWDSVLCKHREIDISLKLGGVGGVGSITSWVMSRNRMGQQRLYWSLGAWYNLLGLKTYKGCSSKWVWNSHNAWEKAINKDMGIDGCIIFSEHQNAKEKRR